MGVWNVEESDTFHDWKKRCSWLVYVASLLSIQCKEDGHLFKSMFYRIVKTKWTIGDVRKNVGCKPGMGTTFPPWCINQARTSCPGVQPCFFANNATRSNRTLFFSKFSLWNRGCHAWQQDSRPRGGHSIVKLNTTSGQNKFTFGKSHHQNESKFYQLFFMSRYT